MTCRCLTGPLGSPDCMRCGRRVCEAVTPEPPEGWRALLAAVQLVRDGIDPNRAASAAVKTLRVP